MINLFLLGIDLLLLKDAPLSGFLCCLSCGKGEPICKRDSLLWAEAARLSHLLHKELTSYIVYHLIGKQMEKLEDKVTVYGTEGQVGPVVRVENYSTKIL